MGTGFRAVLRTHLECRSLVKPSVPSIAGDPRASVSRATLTAAIWLLAVKRPQPRVALHVVIHRKSASNLDGGGSSCGRFELNPIVSRLSGREFSEFGTVRPRVQIPGPRPFLYSQSAISGVVQSRRGTAGAQIRRDL